MEITHHKNSVPTTLAIVAVFCYDVRPFHANVLSKGGDAIGTLSLSDRNVLHAVYTCRTNQLGRQR